MNVIATAFAFREAYGNSMQITGQSDTEKSKLYMKNIVVALTSAKLQNPEDDVLLVTNREIGQPYRELLEQGGVVIRQVPFDRYEMPKKFAWSLAFYKLKALEYLASLEEYEKILLLDNDTITMGSFVRLWQEAGYGLLLYPVGHAFGHEEREKIRKDYRTLYPGEDRNIVHYGGEFLCAKRCDLQAFMQLCSQVHQRIQEMGYPVAENIGDETILAVAAAQYRETHPLYEAGSYICRYWTLKRFYLVSTNTVCNPVAIWHLPAEKDRGFLRMYEYFRKNRFYPDRKKAAKMFGLLPDRRPISMDVLRSNLLQWQSRRR